MQLLIFALNLPWSIVLLIAGIFSIPRRIELHHNPFAIIMYVRSFWFYHWMPSRRGVRAMTLGSVILLGPKLLNNDIEHELVHIKQHEREPFIHPVLNQLETFRRGYRRNKYEEEAYSSSGSVYVGRSLK